MVSAIYPTYKAFVLTAAANVSLDQDTVNDGPYCALLDIGTYTYSTAHDFMSDLTGIVGTDQRIITPTVAAATGLFDGADLTYAAVTGNSVEALGIYRHNVGANTTWKLVAYIDGLNVTPNGGNITVTWNGSGIAQISDRRAKENIRMIGDLCGVLPIYEYTYNGSEQVRVGLMAQDVEKVAPAAVVQIGKYKAVNYERAIDEAVRIAA